ncbi:hypothetical protein [Ornithinibacillus halophilus]|uniref:Uncharacterized protein n=1 Tax=Ornithinibacillus halophilus TaxID=930117 RepID=A0A1M5HJF1_9BACI|nr:hypothetical protein [Ornithinibacillus halophilus]SHG16086.1 hypothetical protein SAMN05216225_10189 [Ornithinibacillus halophilus]
MKINITKKQYKLLTELLYLGEWTANSWRTDGDRFKEYEEIVQYFNSFAKDFGFDDVIAYDQSMGDYFHTLEFEKTVEPFIQENDNEVFWNQLTYRLAKRELNNLKEKPKTQDEYINKLFEIEEKYEIEFEKNGIKSLHIKGME